MTNHPNRNQPKSEEQAAIDGIANDLLAQHPEHPHIAKYLGSLFLDPAKPGGLTRTSATRFPHFVVAARHLRDGSWQVRYEWYRNEQYSDDDISTFRGYLPPRMGDARVAETKNFADGGPEFFDAVEAALKAAMKRSAWLR